MLRGRSERIAASPPQIADGLAGMEGMAPAVDESREPVPSTSSARNRNSKFHDDVDVHVVLLCDRERARGVKAWKEVEKLVSLCLLL